jgi:hypothetical protein
VPIRAVDLCIMYNKSATFTAYPAALAYNYPMHPP